MYENVKARVRDGALLTDCIECLRRVKHIKNNGGKHDALLTPTLVELFTLLFADRIVLLSKTVIVLQNQLIAC